MAARAAGHAAADRRADALVLLAETTLARAPAWIRGSDKYRVFLHVDAAALAAEITSSGRVHIDDGPAIAPATARRVTCDASVISMRRGHRGSVLDVGRSTRSIPPAISRALRVRDHGRCRLLGCHRTKGVEAHHVIHWARSGRTRLGNLVLARRLHPDADALTPPWWYAEPLPLADLVRDLLRRRDQAQAAASGYRSWSESGLSVPRLTAVRRPRT